MALEIDEEIWQPSKWFFAFIFGCCSATIYSRFHFIKTKNKNSTSIQNDSSSFLNLPHHFLSFQSRFLWVFFLASAMEALHTVYGESLFGYHGFSREEVALLLASAQFVSLVFGSFLGFISGFIGYKRASLLCCILYIFGSVAKQSSNYYWFLMGLSSVAVASFLFSCTSETWMAAEHEKLGFRHEWLSDTFWKMSYNGAASALGSAALANVLVKGTIHQRMTLPLMACSVAAALCAFLISRG